MNASNTPRKQRLRQALREHAGWNAYRVANACDLGTMTMAALEGAHVALYGATLDGADAPETMPENNPAPTVSAPVDTDAEDEILANVARTLATLQANRKAALTEARVVELVKQHAGQPATVNLTITTPTKVTVKPDTLMHYAFPALLSAVAAGVNVMLVGPAGSGKTTAAHAVADALERPFAFTGALTSEYKLTGFIDAQGRVVETPFRRMYRDGGIFLFDEMDASLPAPCLAFNAALANGHADFPDGSVARHASFGAIAACNTYGRGADRQYVGRNQLDAATLDRWAVLEWEYDTGLENAMIGLARPSDAPAPIKVKPIEDAAEQVATRQAWAAKVRKVRAKVDAAKVRHVVSPRAILTGCALLIAGWPERLVETAVLYKGLDADTVAKVRA